MVHPYPSPVSWSPVVLRFCPTPLALPQCLASQRQGHEEVGREGWEWSGEGRQVLPPCGRCGGCARGPRSWCLRLSCRAKEHREDPKVPHPPLLDAPWWARLDQSPRQLQGGGCTPTKNPWMVVTRLCFMVLRLTIPTLRLTIPTISGLEADPAQLLSIEAKLESRVSTWKILVFP